MNKTLICSLLSATLILSGCNNASEQAAPATTDAQQASLPQIEQKQYRKTAGDCGGKPCAEISLSYPQFAVVGESAAKAAEAPLNKAIQSLLLNDPASDAQPPSMEAMAEGLLAEHRQINAAAAQTQRWTVERKAEIIYQGRKVVSLSCSEYRDTGGAHPNSTIRLYTLGASSGRTLTANDIFRDGYQPGLLTIAEAEFRHLKQIPFKKSLSDYGYTFPKDGFYLPDNLAMTERGILFHFNPYEIAPYAMGSTELLLRYDVISSFIREEWLQ